MTHRLHAEKAREYPGTQRMAVLEGAERIAVDYPDYLKDESRLSGGTSTTLAFPLSESDVSTFLSTMNRRGIPVTVSGGRTGIVGGAVPMEGALLSLEKMDRILDIRKGENDGRWFVSVQPGILVKELHRRIEQKDLLDFLSFPTVSNRKAVEEFLGLTKEYFYPIDPTETSATLGGTLATNASGERSFHYGPTRSYVREIRVVLANGDVLKIRRGDVRASPGGTFEVTLTNGETISVALPTYAMPSVKSAAGYYVTEGMDLIDLFIGSEGTLGVISEIEVMIVERPENVLSLVAFFPSNRDAVKFFMHARKEIPGVLVFEYFDSCALDVLRSKKQRDGAGSAVPTLPEKARAAIFIELAFREQELDALYASVERLLREHHSSVEDTWSGIEPAEREKIRAFRHAMPESVNEIVALNKRSCPAIHKMGTDIAVPGDKLEDMINYYEGLLTPSGMQYAIFGHIGEHHLHVNILPRTEGEIEQAKRIIRDFARKAVAFGGTISAEHGIGKIKHPYLEILYGLDGMREMARVKRALDPRGILCRGNIFPSGLL